MSYLEDIKWDNDGLVPAIAQDAKTGQILMVAWMNKIAIEQTIDTNLATFWSRSRNNLWNKGLTSGNTQMVNSLRFDCDRDCILLLVEPNGPACHTNRRNCFYTELVEGEEHTILNPEI